MRIATWAKRNRRAQAKKVRIEKIVSWRLASITGCIVQVVETNIVYIMMSFGVAFIKIWIMIANPKYDWSIYKCW